MAEREPDETTEPERDDAPEAEAPTPPDATAEQPIASEPAEEAPAAGAEEDASEPAADAAEDASEPAADAPAEDQAPARAAAPTAGGDPVIPGADLEPDLVPEGEDPLTAEEAAAAEAEAAAQGDDDDADVAPIAAAAIDLAADARYRATGKRKTAVARVILRPGNGSYTLNGRTLDEMFPRTTLQRTIRQPLETVGYEDRMDVVARMDGGGVSAQAGALRHGISRALLEADPNLRGELKRRGFLTRDARAKERKKAGLKKARKRPQFSKR
jgi:small subunit ribosomal protein S9